MTELTNVTEERVKNEVESSNQNNNMEEVRMTSVEVKMQAVEAVSYTHLTLPTILRV